MKGKKKRSSKKTADLDVDVPMSRKQFLEIMKVGLVPDEDKIKAEQEMQESENPSIQRRKLIPFS